MEKVERAVEKQMVYECENKYPPDEKKRLTKSMLRGQVVFG